MSLFQYQGLAEPILPPAGPDAWMQEPQVPMRRKLAAAVAIFMVGPVLVPPDASQFAFVAPVPIRATAGVQPSGSVAPVLVPPDASQFAYPSQTVITARRREQPQGTVLPLLPIGTDRGPLDYPPQLVRARYRQQPQSTVLPPLVTEGPVTDTIYIDLTPDGGCPGDEAQCVGLAAGPVLDQSLCVVLSYTCDGFAPGPVLDQSLWVGPPEA